MEYKEFGVLDALSVGLSGGVAAELTEVDAVELEAVGVEEVEDGYAIDCGVFAQLPTCGGGAGVGGFAGFDFHYYAVFAHLDEEICASLEVEWGVVDPDGAAVGELAGEDIVAAGGEPVLGEFLGG
jgi:hypothetical protein